MQSLYIVHYLSYRCYQDFNFSFHTIFYKRNKKNELRKFLEKQHIYILVLLPLQPCIKLYNIYTPTQRYSGSYFSYYSDTVILCPHPHLTLLTAAWSHRRDIIDNGGAVIRCQLRHLLPSPICCVQ